MYLLGFFICLAVAFTQASNPVAEIQSMIEAGNLSEAETAARQYLETHRDSADAHYLLGYVLFKENKPQPSLSEYTEGARYRPPGAVELEVIGSDYFLLEDYDNADKWLTQSVERNPQNALALYLLGRTKYNRKHFDEAIRYFNESLKLAPGNAKAEDNLGLSYQALGRNDEAIAAYRAAGAYLHLGTLLVENNRSSEAVPYLMRAIQAAPADPVAHRELGKAYLALDKFDQAQIELEKAAHLDPESGPTHFLLAQVYRKQALADKARAETERYAELTGGHSSADDPLSEGRSLVKAGKFNEAEQVVRKYLELHKNSADAYYLLGYILFKEQKAKESLAEYTEGAKYRTPNAGDLEVVGGDYVLLHDYLDADKWFTKSSEWNPGSLQTLYYLGRTKYNENRFEEAVNVFLQCLKIDPKNVKAEDNLGLSYEGMGRTDEAMAAYKTAIALDEAATGGERDSGPYIDLGSLLVDKGRASEAVPYLLQALSIAPEDVRAHRELGKAYLHLNQLENAQKELEKSVQLSPQHAPTHFVLAQVYRRRGLLDKAHAETERYAALTGSHSSDPQ